MKLRVIRPETAPPLGLSTRAWEYLRIGSSAPDDDDTLTGLLTAAITDFERYTGRAVFEQSRTLLASGWPSERTLDLRCGPVSAIGSVKYYDGDGVLQTVSSSDYYTELRGEAASVTLKSNYSMPTLETGRPWPIEVAFTAGYGDAVEDVPETVITAILVYAGHLYDNRNADGSKDLKTVKDALFDPYRLNFLDA